MNLKSQSDLARIWAISEDAPIPYEPEDGPYDPNDEEATAAYLNAARKCGVCGPQKSPTEQRITIRLSPEVVDYFRSTGSGWQARIDETLRKSIRGKAK